MTKNKASKKNKVLKKKRINTDLVAVFAILACVILLGIGVSCFQNSDINGNAKNSTASMVKKQAEEETALIITLGVAAVVIIGLYTGIKIKNTMKKKKIIEEKLRKHQEIEAARKRLEELRYNELLMAGNTAVSEKRKEKYALSNQKTVIRHKYDFNSIDEYSDDKRDYKEMGGTYYYDEDDMYSGEETDISKSAFINAVKENKSLVFSVAGIFAVIIIFVIIICI